ncbi:MAG: putative lyase [Rhodobacteraceae bacterium HLUCCA08]|nr:MAG: putative lyase [Rhodobacteraceae bacterium HLUCCA08]
MTRLEHVNLTVRDPRATADWMADLFGWRIRWDGDAIKGGHTIHIGTEEDYLALYTGPDGGLNLMPADENYLRRGGLNHVGVVVAELDATLAKVRAAGFETYSHADYAPGRRFYFRDRDGIEFEVVSYA